MCALLCDMFLRPTGGHRGANVAKGKNMEKP
jgi:hypothetical protein